MINVKVSYSVKPEFVEQNKANIIKFLTAFKTMNPSDFRYNVFVESDGLTFVHMSTYRNEEVQKMILNVDSFKSFQKERDESGLNNSHKVEVLSLVGASSDLLG